MIDQDLPPFVIAENGRPVGPILDGDSVIFFNFRGDRAIEITRAFEDATLTEFDRGPLPAVRYAGMMRYDGDLKLPTDFLVDPPAIDRTMGEHLARGAPVCHMKRRSLGMSPTFLMAISPASLIVALRIIWKSLQTSFLLNSARG